MKDIRDYSLLAHNTFGIDAKCRRFLEYSSVEEAQQIVAALTDADKPLLILGGGSNLLLTGDYAGTVLHSSIMGIEVLGNGELAAAEHDDALLNPEFVFLRCGSGEVFDDVVAYAVEHGYHGAENLSIIPGEVGASAVQNIGAYGVEAKDIIYKVEAVEIATGRVVVFDNQIAITAIARASSSTSGRISIWLPMSSIDFPGALCLIWITAISVHPWLPSISRILQPSSFVTSSSRFATPSCQTLRCRAMRAASS